MERNRINTLEKIDEGLASLKGYVTSYGKENC